MNDKKVIGILTTFYDFNRAYSLASVVYDQLVMNVKYGYKTVLFVLPSFKDDDKVPQGVEIRKIVPQLILEKYKNFGNPKEYKDEVKMVARILPQQLGPMSQQYIERAIVDGMPHPIKFPMKRLSRFFFPCIPRTIINSRNGKFLVASRDDFRAVIKHVHAKFGKLPQKLAELGPGPLMIPRYIIDRGYLAQTTHKFDDRLGMIKCRIHHIARHHDNVRPCLADHVYEPPLPFTELLVVQVGQMHDGKPVKFFRQKFKPDRMPAQYESLVLKIQQPDNSDHAKHYCE